MHKLINILLWFKIQLTFTCSNSTIKTLEKGVKCSTLTIKTPERRQWRHSDVFIVNFKHFTPFSRVSIVDFEQVNVSWVGAL